MFCDMNIEVKGFTFKGLFRDCVIMSLTDGQKIELASVDVSLGLCNRCADAF